MSQRVLQSLDATIEAGSIDLLVEVIEDGTRNYANLVITSEEDVEKEPPTFDLNRKDALAVRDLMQDTLDAMGAIASEATNPAYDALRLLLATHYQVESIARESGDGEVFCDDLFARDLLNSREVGQSGEYEPVITYKGRTLIEQVYRRLQKEQNHAE